MTISIEEFHQDFFQEVMASADVDGQYAEDAFFELFCEYLDTQPYASMGGESHGNGTETTRPAPSDDTAEPSRARRDRKRRKITR